MASFLGCGCLSNSIKPEVINLIIAYIEFIRKAFLSRGQGTGN
jgi:hypothetical protein